MASPDGGDRGGSPLLSPGKNESESESSYAGSASSEAGMSPTKTMEQTLMNYDIPYIDGDQEESGPSNQHLDTVERVPIQTATTDTRDTLIPDPASSQNHDIARDEADDRHGGERADQLSRAVGEATRAQALDDTGARPLASTSSRPSSSGSSLRGDAPEFHPNRLSHPNPPLSGFPRPPPAPFPQAAASLPILQQPVPQRRPPPEISLPRWQPDGEVSNCPICRTQFSMFVRKHHCRKCGRVVCANCSPHRITIPYQYIVRAPGDVTLLRSSGFWGDESGIADFSTIGGGERVRLCNPCVPDPNTTPPATQSSPRVSHFSPRSAHQRSRSSATGNSSGLGYASLRDFRQTEDVYSRMRSATVSSTLSHSSRRGPQFQVHNLGQYPAYGWDPTRSSFASSSRQPQPQSQSYYRSLLDGHGSNTASSSSASASASASALHNRPLPPSPQIAEEDECPVCHNELPSRDLPNFDSLRETHITSCIMTHSTYSPAPSGPGQAGTHGTPPPRAVRRTGMFAYAATEKDCVDAAECSICFEEYQVGDPMARLECMCRFHRPCILLWFQSHPGRCPVHQHDSYGY